MLLAGALALLSALTGSAARGVAIWTAAGTFGAAAGPALGGVLTQLFDWRAIFVFQAPVALVALVAAFESHLHPRAERPPSGRRWRRTSGWHSCSARSSARCSSRYCS